MASKANPDSMEAGTELIIMQMCRQMRCGGCRQLERRNLELSTLFIVFNAIPSRRSMSILCNAALNVSMVQIKKKRILNRGCLWNYEADFSSL